MIKLLDISHFRTQTPPVRRFQVVTLLLVFLIPFVTKGLIIPILIWAFFWASLPKKNFKINVRPIFIFSGVYIFHLLAMGYTENLDAGFQDLEQKLSLLVFPLMLGTVHEHQLPKRTSLFTSFIIGLIVAILISFVESFINYSDTGLITEFYMSAFSYPHHPSYLALYINIALAAILMHLFRSQKARSYSAGSLIVAAILITGVVYSASKMGFIQFAVLIPYVFFYHFILKNFKLKPLFAIAGLTVFFLVLFFSNPVASYRVSHTMQVVESPEAATQQEVETESTVARIVTWQLTLDEIMKNPLGVGTGDVQDVLNKRYLQEGYELLAETKLNPHNNYLQLALAQGLPALAYFLFTLIFPFGRIVKNRDWLYAFFILSMAMHLMVESMLEKQSGVVFFAFFNAFLFFTSNRYSKKSDAP